jgi:hypothetical protein
VNQWIPLATEPNCSGEFLYLVAMDTLAEGLGRACPASSDSILSSFRSTLHNSVRSQALVEADDHLEIPLDPQCNSSRSAMRTEELDVFPNLSSGPENLFKVF